MLKFASPDKKMRMVDPKIPYKNTRSFSSILDGRLKKLFFFF